MCRCTVLLARLDICCVSMSRSLLAFTLFFFFSSRRRHTRFDCDWSSDVCSSDLTRPSARVGRSPFSPAADSKSCAWPCTSRSSLHPRPSGLYQPSPLRSSFGGTAGGGVQRVWSGAAPPAHPLPGRRQHNTPCSNRGSEVLRRGV